VIGAEFVLGLVLGGIMALMGRSGYKRTSRAWKSGTRAVRRFTHGVYAWIATVGFVGLMVVLAWRS